ncbi:hypothetical protein [Yinghuangia soli]|uniref:Uncharacterized protein n=1 Tax=Yinghuangia soli TaxID=2908204 RepID=A0AA41Q9U8_9ACTN|nr:hypothetical protein [Yinghuangia soli]MCF2534068.1 hypothetical protein [Yinghuangia soli]
MLASWLTGRGHVRASQVQAQAAAETHHRSTLRETRRLAYLELIEQAHVVSELHWRLSDANEQPPDPAAQATRIEELRVQLREAFAPLMQRVRITVLEGPVPVADAAQALQTAALAANRALWALTQNTGAHEAFDQAHRQFRCELDHFIEIAREAMDHP